MNYVPFHVGDWDTSTRLLSPSEKGVYIDLLMLYYSLERPLMRSECDRIARAYAEADKEALEYVLDRFFDREGDTYVHHRCEAEIATMREKSAKAAKSAKARWDKRIKPSAKVQAVQTNVQEGCKTDAGAMQTQCERICERSADALLTNNQEPITNTYNPLTPLQGELLSVEKPIEEKPKAKRQWQGVMTDRPDDVTEEHWDQWMPIRKLKNRPVTEAAIERMRREAAKAGLTLDQAVVKCIENGWAGFEARYLENQKARQGGIERLGNSNPSDYLPNSKLKRQECRKYTPGI